MVLKTYLGLHYASYSRTRWSIGRTFSAIKRIKTLLSSYLSEDEPNSLTLLNN